jgi:hypothetical protein
MKPRTLVLGGSFGCMSTIYKAKGITLAEQYYDVGKKFANLLVVPKLEKRKILLARKVLTHVQTLASLSTFYSVFQAWCAGLEISEEVGMYLLADNLVGCQTAMVRYKSGIALLHTEEDFNDVQARMITPHTVEFDDNGRRLVTLMYHDLIPGAALYGWQQDMIVAVDSIWLREDGIEKLERPMLANIVAWMIWYLYPSEASAEQVEALIKRLGNVIDGYAINVVRKTGENIEGYKITFARGDSEIERVWDQPGDNVRQVNIIEPRYARKKKRIAMWRHAPWKMYVDYRGFLKRLRDMKAHIQAHKKWLQMSLETSQAEVVHRAIQSKIFSDYKEEYATEWMGAMCVGLLDQSGLSVSVKLHDRRPIEVMEYVDKV